MKELDPEEEGEAKRGFNEYNKATATTEEFFKFLKIDPALKKVASTQRTQRTEPHIVTCCWSDLAARNGRGLQAGKRSFY